MHGPHERQPRRSVSQQDECFGQRGRIVDVRGSVQRHDAEALPESRGIGARCAESLLGRDGAMPMVQQ